MALFGRKKVQETAVTCSCGGKCEQSSGSAKYIVLGACCQKSKQTFENVQQAVNELGLDETVINIGDMVEIAKYGVMQTPAFVIDQKVVAYGKLLQVEDAKQLIRAYL